MAAPGGHGRGSRGASTARRCASRGRCRSRAAGRPLDLRLPATAGAGPARDQRAGATRGCLRGGRTRCEAAGDHAVPRRARSAGRGHQRGARGSASRARSGSAGSVVTRPAPDDRQGHRLPRPRGRDRHGQRHALAGHLGAPPRRRPAPCPAPRRRRPPARVIGRERDRPRGPKALTEVAERAGGPESPARRSPARPRRQRAGWARPARTQPSRRHERGS